MGGSDFFDLLWDMKNVESVNGTRPSMIVTIELVLILTTVKFKKQKKNSGVDLINPFG